MKILTPESDILNKISESLLAKFPMVNLVDINYFSGAIPANSIVVSDNLDSQQVVEAFGARVKSHLVQYNKNFFDLDIETAAALIESPARYFENPGPVALDQIYKSKVVNFISVNDKINLMKDVELFLTENVAGSIQDPALRIIEELYMNAILDAPIEARKTDQSQVQLPKESAQLTICLFDAYLSITCRDPYGSLMPVNLIRRLNQVYKEGVGSAMRMNSGRGAGIGCVLMFEQCSGLYFGVKKGIATVVSALIPYKLSNKQREEFKKNLHFIEMT